MKEESRPFLIVLSSFRETPPKETPWRGVTRSFLEGTRLFLNSDSTVGQGDSKLVNIIEDWGVLAEYAGEKLGFYQLLLNDRAVEIRVLTGRVGFKHEFASREDPVYIKILDFCRRQRYIKVTQTTRDEQFFK